MPRCRLCAERPLRRLTSSFHPALVGMGRPLRAPQTRGLSYPLSPSHSAGRPTSAPSQLPPADHEPGLALPTRPLLPRATTHSAVSSSSLLLSDSRFALDGHGNVRTDPGAGMESPVRVPPVPSHDPGAGRIESPRTGLGRFGTRARRSAVRFILRAQRAWKEVDGVTVGYVQPPGDFPLDSTLDTRAVN